MNSGESLFKMVTKQIIQAKVQILHSRFIEVTFHGVRALFPLQLVSFLWQTDREFKHRRYNKQMQQLLYEPMCQLFCSTPSGSETQLQICY